MSKSPNTVGLAVLFLGIAFIIHCLFWNHSPEPLTQSADAKPWVAPPGPPPNPFPEGVSDRVAAGREATLEGRPHIIVVDGQGRVVCSPTSEAIRKEIFLELRTEFERNSLWTGVISGAIPDEYTLEQQEGFMLAYHLLATELLP